MIKIQMCTVQTQVTKNFVSCPKCGYKDWFYSLWPTRCGECLCEFPNRGEKIPEDIKRRIAIYMKE